MRRVLVDTSVLIDFLRRKDKRKSLFYQLFSSGKFQPVIALISVSELWAGASMAQKETAQKVEKLLKGCQILFPDLEVAKITGQILRETDYQIAFQDAQIAAFALKQKLPLLTLNRKDFLKVKELQFFS